MSVTLAEHAESRKLTQTVSGQGQRLRWNAYGSTDETAVRAALVATAPVVWDGLTLVGFDANPHMNSGTWDCTADYAFSAEQAAGVKGLDVPGTTDPLGPEFEFDLTAQQAHISQSLLTVTSRYDDTDGGLTPPPNWAPSTGYAINVYVANFSNVYRCTQAGTSAGGGGPSGTGTGITDGGCKWDYVAAVGPATPVPVWAPSTLYLAGKVDSHGFLYELTTPGTSSATGDGPAGAGAGIADGTCVWRYVGPDLDPKAPDYGQAIGATRDRVTGTDVYVGHLEFSITAQYYPVTLELIQTMLNLVATFNRAAWYNFPPKTLLYLGCTGSPRPGNIWTLKHRFAASPNLRNIAVGTRLTIPFKGGWDFLWAAYTTGTVRTAHGEDFTVQVPYAAYVEQVYRAGDFTTLPIG